MAINKVIYGNDTLIDLTSDTVDSSNLLSGYTAHDRSGASIVGSAVIPTVNDGTLTIQKNGTNVATFSANQSSNTTANILVDELTESTDNEPYTLRQGKGDMVDMELVGGSFAWNQLVQNGNFASTSNWTAEGSFSVSNNVGTYLCNKTSGWFWQQASAVSGHKYIALLGIKKTTASAEVRIYMISNSTLANVVCNNSADWVNYGLIFTADNSFIKYVVSDRRSSNWDNIYIRNCMLIDLTQKLGTLIADYIYNLEQATAGSGVAFFRQYFPNAYYAYDAGSIQSVNVASRKVVGFNQWDEVWEVGAYNNTGKITGNYVRCKNQIKVKPSTTYYIYSKPSKSIQLYYWDKNGNYIDYIAWNKNSTFTTPIGCDYITFFIESSYGTVYSDGDICINISDTSKNGTYEPYESHIANFDATKQLRGIPSLVNNKLVYDGDIYTPNGITRKYGIVDLGTLTWGGTTPSYYSDDLTSVIKKPATNNDTINAICSIYPLTSRYNMFDKCVTCDTSGRIYGRDATYNDYTAFKTAMNGVYLVYELATPTTESAEPYQNPQRADASGTEEFIDFGVSAGTRDVSIPCGHNSTYKSSEVIQPLEDYVDGYRINEIRDDVASMIPIKLYATGSFTSSTSTTTTVTVTNANINYNANNPIEVTSDVFGLTVSNISVSGSGTGATISITFPKMSSAQTVNYRVYIITI